MRSATSLLIVRITRRIVTRLARHMTFEPSGSAGSLRVFQHIAGFGTYRYR